MLIILLHRSFFLYLCLLLNDRRKSERHVKTKTSFPYSRHERHEEPLGRQEQKSFRVKIDSPDTTAIRSPSRINDKVYRGDKSVAENACTIDNQFGLLPAPTQIFVSSCGDLVV